MKTLFIALLVSSTLLLSSETNAKPPTKKVHKILNRIMSYPDFADKSKAKGIVFVSFETRSDGTIKVLGLNASNKKFGTYVTDKLSKIKFDETDTNQVYNYKFTFKPEK